MKKTYQEILEILKANLQQVDDFAYDGFGERKFPKAKYGTPEYETQTSAELGDVVQIEQVGGEGEGEHWHVVFHFVDHDVYIKVTGFYSSYDGTEFYDGWDCCENVKPQQRTITVYEA